MLLTWSQPAVEHFLEYLSEARFYNKDFPLICFSIPKRTINEHVNSLHIRNDPSSHCSCHCWSERGRGLTVSGTGVFLCGLVIMWVVCESDNIDKIRKLSRHVSYILLSCSCVSTECKRQWNATYFMLYSVIIQLLAQWNFKDRWREILLRWIEPQTSLETLILYHLITTYYYLLLVSKSISHINYCWHNFHNFILLIC